MIVSVGGMVESQIEQYMSVHTYIHVHCAIIPRRWSLFISVNVLFGELMATYEGLPVPCMSITPKGTNDTVIHTKLKYVRIMYLSTHNIRITQSCRHSNVRRFYINSQLQGSRR